MTWNCTTWTQGFETLAAGGALVVLDLGAPCFVPSTGAYGTQLFDEYICTPMAQETPLVQSFVRGYEAGHGGGTAPSIVAVGESNSLTAADPQSNYRLSTDQLRAQAAVFYNTLVAGMSAPGPALLTVWGANDMEQSGGGNWYGPADTRAWVDAYGAAAGITRSKPACSASVPGMLADFGDDVVGNGGWQAADIYYVAWGAPVACAVPEIYYSSMAAEWANLNRWAAANRLAQITFTGVMSENNATGGDLSAPDSLYALRSATGQAIPYLTTIQWSTALGWRHFAFLGDGPLGGTPHAVSWGTGHTDVFWRGTDSRLWHGWYFGGTWSGPQPLGGSLAGDPSPVSWGPGHIDVFWKGSDGQLWHVYYVNGWHGPESLGGAPMGSSPHAASDQVGSIGVFWTGTDQDLWEMRYANGWAGPFGLGAGPLASEPQPVALAPHVMSVFWTGADRNLWRLEWNGVWQGPMGIFANNDVRATPSPVSWGGGHVDVFWPRADGSLWHAWVLTAGFAWSGPEKLSDAGVASRVTTVSFAVGHLQVFWQDGSRNLWEEEFANGWQAAMNLGDGPIASLPTAVAGGPGMVDVLWMGTDPQTSLWHDWHP
jgi:hypothetical protein